MNKRSLLHAAFLVEGLHDAGYKLCVNALYNNMGCIEMIDELVEFVPFMDKLAKAAELIIGDNYPGVFDYEVSSEIGMRFGKYIILNRETPPVKTVREWIIKEVTAFFTQGLSPVECSAIQIAINHAVNQ